jgi:hypothetical protein
MKKFTLLSLMVLLVGFSFAQQKKVAHKKTNVISSHEKNVTGSSVTTSSFYIPSSTSEFVFTLTTETKDMEYVDKVSLTFPTGIVPKTAGSTAVINSSGYDGGEALNAIAGQTISWGDDDNSYGGINSPGTYSITVTATVGAVSGNQTVNYTISGDQYGAAPNEVSGTCTLTAAPACLYPKELGLSDLSASSATLVWTNQGTAAIWNVKWGLTGFSGAGTAINGLTAETTTLSGLAGSTTYDFYVQSDCAGDGTSSWAGPYTFSTPCPASSLPYSEDFEAAIDCWSNVDADGDTYVWEAATDLAHSGSGSVVSASYDNAAGALTPENWLMSPAIDLSTASGNGALTLKYYVVAVDQAWPAEKYKVVVSTTGTASTANFTDVVFEETITAGEYFERIVNLDAYAGQTINIAWVHYDCTDNYMISLDDVSVFENASNDVAVTAILLPTNESGCTKTASESVKATISNLGGSTISNFDVTLMVDGNTIATEQITSSIAPAGNLDYTFTAKANLSELGYYSVQVVAVVAGDVEPSNDSFTKEVRNTDGQITITVAADSAGGQSWSIKNALDQVVATHGGYQWGVTVEDNVCVLANDCYVFSWVDTNGGSNDVTVEYNGTIKESLTLTVSQDIEMIGGCPNAIETVENNSLSTYPNPTTGIINVETTNNSIISIYNIIGEEVMRVNSKETINSIDLSKLSNGAYLVKVVSEDNKISTTKINLIK